MFHTTNRDLLAPGVDLRVQLPQLGLDLVRGDPSGEIVAADNVFVDMIGHHAGHAVVGLIEDQRFPGLPEDAIVGPGTQPMGQHAQFFARGQEALGSPASAASARSAAIGALEHRVEFPLEHRPGVRRCCSIRAS